MTGQLRDITVNLDGTQNITVTVRGDWRKEIRRLAGKELDIEIKPHREKRSPDANAFCWALCRDIGEAIRPAVPDREIYRTAIRDMGKYIPVPIRSDMVEDAQRLWSANGTGWFIDVIDDSKLPGYKFCRIYYGSSTYDSKTMSKLIDYLVSEAEQMGIKIPASKEQIQRIKAAWSPRWQPKE